MGNWTVAKGKAVHLDGIQIEVDLRNNNPYGLTLRDLNGNQLRISSTYGLEILVPAKPPTVKKWKVSGTVGADEDFTVDKLFDGEYSAKTFTEQCKEKAVKAGLEVHLKVEEIEVPEE